MGMVNWNELGATEGVKVRRAAKAGQELFGKLVLYADNAKRAGGEITPTELCKAAIEAEDLAAQKAGCEPGTPKRCLILGALCRMGLGTVEGLTYPQARPLLRLFHMSPSGTAFRLQKAVIDVCGGEELAKIAVKDLVAEIKSGKLQTADDIGAEVDKLLGKQKAPTFWMVAAKKLRGENAPAHAIDFVRQLGADAIEVLAGLHDVAEQLAEGRLSVDNLEVAEAAAAE